MSKTPLIFKDYLVTEAYVKTNLKFKSKQRKEKIKIDEDFSCEIGYSREGHSIVQLNLKIENSKEELPFELSVNIAGFFESNFDELKKEEFINLLKVNAVAILYPYLRNVVTNLTAQANAFQPLILPARNFASMLEQNGKITITEFSDKLEENKSEE